MKTMESVRPSQQHWKVVIIDDSEDDRAEVRRLLLGGSPRSYEFVEYETAAEGVAALMTRGAVYPSCVVLDYHLPDMMAPEALRSLRDERGATICPVVVMTGNDDEDVGRAVLRAGAEDFVGKSWMTAQSLTRALENALVRWRMAREVRLGESRLQGLALAVPQPVWMLDEQGRTVHANRRWLDYFGKLEPDNDKWQAILHPDDVERALGQIQSASAQGESYQLEARLRRADGAYRWHHVSAAPVRDASGAVTHWYGVNTDVHEIKENDARLRLALEASKTGIWTWDLTTDEVEWTRECYDIHGIEPGGFPGTGAAFFLLVHVDDRDMVEREVRSSIANRSRYRIEFRIVQPDGTVKWVQNLGRASYSDAGAPLRMVGTITDVSERRVAQDALAARERELRALADNTPDMIVRVDRELRRVFVNAAAARAAELPVGELLIQSESHVVASRELRLTWDDALRTVFSTGAPYQLELDAPGSPGSRSYTSRMVPESNAAGEVEFVLCIVTDVTEPKRVENALRASEERLARAQRAARTGTWDWNVITGESMWTEEAWLLFGREPFSADVTFELWLSCVHPDDRVRAAQTVQTAMTGDQTYRDEFRILHADGRVTLLETFGEVVRDAAGRVVRLVGTVRDITERRRAEMKLQRALDESRRATNAREKLVSLVSHDLKGPLHTLAMGIALLELDANANPQTVARMKRQAARMERIIDELLDVAQLHSGAPLQLARRDTDLLGLVRGLVTEYQERSPKHQVSLSGATAPIMGHWDPVRLERVVSNLLSNAMKYSPAGGSVWVIIELSKEGGAPCAILKVADQGIGIAPHEQATIFDWYARAENAKRASIQGTGVGLAGVKDIVEQHGGRITLESGLGQGSVFTVTLPLHRSDPSHEARSSPRASDEDVPLITRGPSGG